MLYKTDAAKKTQKSIFFIKNTFRIAVMKNKHILKLH